MNFAARRLDIASYLWIVDTKRTKLKRVDRTSVFSAAGSQFPTSIFFFEVKAIYIKQASHLIKNLPVPLDMVRKRVRKKLAALITL
jgi:hypothetical protein